MEVAQYMGLLTCNPSLSWAFVQLSQAAVAMAQEAVVLAHDCGVLPHAASPGVCELR